MIRPLSTLSKTLLISLGTFVSLALGVVMFISAIEYKPWGVPDSKRAAYEAKISKIRHHNSLVDKLHDTPKPIAKFHQKVHDFGTIQMGEQNRYPFELTNDGNMPLRFKLPRSREKLQFETHQGEIAPGHSQMLVANWTPELAEQKKVETSIAVQTNDPLRPSVTLRVSGEVAEKLFAPSAIDLGRIDFGDDASQTFYVASQTSKELQVTEIHCEAPEFVWAWETIDPRQLKSEHESLRSAALITVSCSPRDYGASTHSLRIESLVGGKKISREVELRSFLKPPISFQHPDIHQADGLSIGTVDSKDASSFFVTVRVRSRQEHSLDVLKFKPDFLNVSLNPNAKLDGVYKLEITVPKGTQTAQFNRDDHRGYVQVGDPKDPNFSDWLPIEGAVFNSER